MLPPITMGSTMGQILPFTYEQNALDPENLALAARAYDKAVVDFAGAPEVVREVIAQQIIRLISQGERDPSVLYERAITSAGIPAGSISQPRFRFVDALRNFGFRTVKRA